jgi:hypothetical protein
MGATPFAMSYRISITRRCKSGAAASWPRPSQRHIALHSSVEYFQKFRRGDRGKSKADDLRTVRQHLFE